VPRELLRPPSLANSGFLTLSTLCSPNDLPVLFHPGSALGISPSRFYSFCDAVRLLRRRDPCGLQRIHFRSYAVPLRLCSSQKSRPPYKVIHPHSCDSLHGLLPLRGLLHCTAVAWRYVPCYRPRCTRRHVPRVLRFNGLQARRRNRTSGCYVAMRSSSLSRAAYLHGVFHLVSFLNASTFTKCWVMASFEASPRRGRSVTRSNSHLFALGKTSTGVC
jgi:hypothetical protein